jgi:hypothetical protein
MDNFDDIKIEESGGEERQPSYKPPSMFQMTFSKLTGDMRFIGIYYLITGGLACLSIIGAVIGIPTIFMGLRLRESADQLDMFKTTNNPHALRMGFELQGKFFRIQKILIIVGLVIMGLYIIGIIIFMAIGLGSFYNEFEQLSYLK